MYVTRFDKDGVLWKVTIFEKQWSDLMYSHELKEVSSKKFIFHRRGYRWVYKEIGKILFSKKELEIING